MTRITHEVNVPFKKATFGMGCFWACDALFGAQVGVLRTRVGYAGGTTLKPQYRELATSSNFSGDHTEVIEIDYDPQSISYDTLLDLFWRNHEYEITTATKKQYMSLILYHDEDQKQLAELSLKRESNNYNNKVLTEILPAAFFYPAENYHQKYRLQQHSWLCEDIGLTDDLLQTSYVACKINGYLVGVGRSEDFDKELAKMGVSDKVRAYVRQQFIQNEGGSLYC